MTRQPRLRLLALAVIAVVVVSCDDNPTRPTTTAPPPVPSAPVIVTRLELTAPPAIEPQKSAQLTATALKSNGSSEDVTPQAQWTAQTPGIVQVTAGGLATGVRTGEGTITARYAGHGTSAQVLILPAGTYKLTGRVTEAGAGVDGVRLAVVSGVGEGLTTSSRDGYFTFLGVAGRVVLQAKKDGYDNKLVTVDVNSTLTHNFEMTPVRQRTNLAGTYSLRLAANCETPSSLSQDPGRERTYTATLVQQGPELRVTLSGADFILTNGRGNTFEGIEDPFDNVSFTIGSGAYYYYSYYYYPSNLGIAERLSATRTFRASGSVSARATSSAIIGRLEGQVQVQDNAATPQFQTCYSRSHTFEMRRP